MSTSQFAVAVALVLGAVAVFGGFGSFVIVLVFAIVGLLAGRIIEGKLDLRALVGQGTDKRGR
jgi:uncharacterized membrane protein